jgi:H+/Cl- antiporter ClcA
MKRFLSFFEQMDIVRYLGKWMLLVLPVSILVGSMVALFLWLLDLATQTRWEHPWLLYCLPIAGVAIVALYRFKGKNAEAGNNLVVDEIHKPGGGIPFRMAPFVLITTVVTHLFGGSAGREGTAVQIGGSLAAFVGKLFRISEDDLKVLLMTGVAAGFGAVFGTPVAGTVFALEVLAIGRIKYDALIPCFMAAIMADIVCMMYGIQHTHYQILYHSSSELIFPYFRFEPSVLLMAAIGGICFGLAGLLFSELSHSIKSLATKHIKHKLLIPVIGGCVVIVLAFFLGTDYLGLGVTTQTGDGVSIVNAFKPGGADNFSWLWKLIFTAVTLSTGFKGGEVTPLFFIGAALGNSLGVWTGTPVDLMAGLGFIAVFAAATNTPLACTLMGVELFGGEHVVYFAIACFIAYYFSGHTGIYSSQRVEVYKGGLKKHHLLGDTLKSIRDRRLGNNTKN